MQLKYDPQKFLAFCLYHLTHHMTAKFAEFHKELAYALKASRIAVAAPRGHAKSTWCSVFYPLYMLLENPGIQVLLVSATGSLAEVMLAKIRKELESNQSIHEFYGDIDGAGKTKWTSEELHLPNGSVIYTKGSGKQIRGFRPDIIIGDDLETDDMVINPTRRSEFDHWFWGTLTGTLKGAGGQIVVVGTILHPDSFLSTLMKEPREGWKTRFYTAIQPDGSSLWPELWPISRLNTAKQEMGIYLFNQEYMNQPILDSDRKFQPSWFKHEELPPANLAYFTTVDPAIETGNANDYTAIVTCGVDARDNIYVVDVVNKRMLPNDTIEAIFNVYKRFNPQVIGIETQGFQKMLKYELEKQKRERNLYPIIRDLKHGGRRKGLRIEALQPLYENGKVTHCGHPDNYRELELQLGRFPSPIGHDDIIDALAYHLDIIRAGPKEAKYVNPESFMARLEYTRTKTNSPRIWGNHKTRKAIW